MSVFKRRTTPRQKVQVGVDVGVISAMTFIYKTEKTEEAQVLVQKEYPGEVTYDEAGGYFVIPWTEEETLLFSPNDIFYMDTRIELEDGYVPPTEIISLKMNPTLFGESEDGE